eukprot:Rhum_TRINITY_DN9618_c0_g1::Rhum_TRINITY_DN9618_c0_g1_i1::g.34378::m.34378
MRRVLGVCVLAGRTSAALAACRRFASQRLPLGDGVDLVIVENVRVHGNRRHPNGALCAAMTTDGLRHGMQHELAFLLEHPFPVAGMIPHVVTNVCRYVAALNKKGVFVRAGDLVDVCEMPGVENPRSHKCLAVAPFGAMGDGEGVEVGDGADASTPDPRTIKAVAFAPLPAHDEYWLGEHEFRTPPYPVLLATVLSFGERSFAGAAGGAARLFAAQRGYWRYAPCLPYIPAARIPGARTDLAETPLEKGGDMVLLSDVLEDQARLPSPVRLNGGVAEQVGNMLTLTLPAAVGDMLHGPLAEAAAARTDQALTLATDAPEGAGAAPASLAVPEDAAAFRASLDAPSVVPAQPSKGLLGTGEKGAATRFAGSGVVLGYFADEGHLDTYDVVQQRGAAMAGADTCRVSLETHDVWRVELRQRAWVRLVKAFEQQTGFVCPAEEAGGVHFEVRWTRGEGLPFYQDQAARSNETYRKMRSEGLAAFGADGEAAASSDTARAGSELLSMGGGEDGGDGGGGAAAAAADGGGGSTAKVVLVSGDPDALSPEEKLKVRMGGGGGVFKASSDELRAPMTASQHKKYEEELNSHKVMAEEVSESLARRDAERLEGNVIRLVWSYDAEDEKAADELQAELKAAAQAWAAWKKHLVGSVMTHIDGLDPSLVALPPQGSTPDISPNLCLRVVPREAVPNAAAGQTTVFGLMVKDGFLRDTAPLMRVLEADPLLQDCPVSYPFDLFLNVAVRGTYSAARLRTKRWTELEDHYRQLSQDAAARLASLEADAAKLAEREAKVRGMEEALAAREAAAAAASGAGAAAASSAEPQAPRV